MYTVINDITLAPATLDGSECTNMTYTQAMGTVTYLERTTKTPHHMVLVDTIITLDAPASMVG